MTTRRVSPKPPTPAELLRLNAGIRRPYLAITVGICSETLKRLERGLTWSKPETLQRIAAALGVDLDTYVLAVLHTWRQAQARKRAA